MQRAQLSQLERAVTGGCAHLCPLCGLSPPPPALVHLPLALEEEAAAADSAWPWVALFGAAADRLLSFSVRLLSEAAAAAEGAEAAVGFLTAAVAEEEEAEAALVACLCASADEAAAPAGRM